MNEIFLSYARVDDEISPTAGERPGWVKHFHDALWYELKQRVANDLHFWRDVNDIEPDGVFAREIETALQKAKLMVAVLSPNYVKRPWCRRELESFAAIPPDAEAPQRCEQIFKILKHNVPEEALPLVLQNRGRGYKFFAVDPATGLEQPFFQAGRIRERHEQAYLDLINELAERIKRRLPELLGADPPLPQPTRFVFVAPPPASSSVMEVYRALTKQLAAEGLGVLPRPGDFFPDALGDAERVLAEATEKAELLIHLVGESSGKTCDGATEPMVPMQLRHSAEAMARRPALCRLVWLPGKIPSANAEHAALLRALVDCDAARAPLLPGRDEIVSGAYDSFLGLVLRTLRREVPAPPQKTEPAGKTLWVVAADEDVAFARGAFRSALRRLGVEVEVPLPPDRPKDVRDAHEASRLQTADAAVVLWGTPRVDWVEEQLYRLRRQWRAQGRARAFDALALVLLGPDSDEKRDEEPAAPGDAVVDLRGGLDAASLHPLARRLGLEA